MTVVPRPGRQGRHIGGRRKGDPNVVHPFTRKAAQVLKTATERRCRKGGKISITVGLPPEFYEQLRQEAVARNTSMSRVVLEVLSAGWDP